LKTEIEKRATLIEIKEYVEISKGVRSTGELGDKKMCIRDRFLDLHLIANTQEPGLSPCQEFHNKFFLCF